MEKELLECVNVNKLNDGEFRIISLKDKSLFEEWLKKYEGKFTSISGTIDKIYYEIMIQFKGNETL
jgi:hypothetical protein